MSFKKGANTEIIMSERSKLSADPKPSDEMLEAVAKAFSLTNFRFVRKLENAVYAAQQNKKEVFVRFTSRMRRSSSQIAAELKWIKNLDSEGFAVPKVVLTPERELSTDFRYDQELFHIAVFEKIIGKNPNTEVLLKDGFLESMGMLMARFHNHSQRHGYHNLDREQWYDERGTRFARKFALRSKNDPFSIKFLEHLDWMKHLPKSQENYGLVHADLNLGNLFVTESDEIYVIDFDDSCFHWFVFDLAIMLMPISVEAKSDGNSVKEQKALNALIYGYRKTRHITDEDIDLIPKFIDFAFLRVLLWSAQHEYLGTFEPETLPQVGSMQERTKDLLKKRGVITPL